MQRVHASAHTAPLFTALPFRRAAVIGTTIPRIILGQIRIVLRRRGLRRRGTRRGTLA